MPFTVCGAPCLHSLQSFQFLVNSRKELPVETQTASSKSQSTRTSAFVVFIALCALVYVTLHLCRLGAPGVCLCVGVCRCA